MPGLNATNIIKYFIITSIKNKKNEFEVEAEFLGMFTGGFFHKTCYTNPLPCFASTGDLGFITAELVT